MVGRVDSVGTSIQIFPPIVVMPFRLARLVIQVLLELQFGLIPATDMFVVFLSNRVHPNGKGDVAALRGKVATIAASAITDLSVVGSAHAEVGNTTRT